MYYHSKISFSIWVPIIVYLKKDYKNDLLSALSNNDLSEAFKCSFMLNSTPTELHPSTAALVGLLFLLTSYL